MYRVGKREKNKRRQRFLFALSVTIVGIVIGLKKLDGKTTITQSTAVVKSVDVDGDPVHTYDEGIFTIQIPDDWQPAVGEKTPYLIYSWQSSGAASDTQLIQVYQDNVPQNLAVNRVLAVTANGNQVTTLGTVSDNCADFTKSSSPIATTAGTLAKWQGINFLCDLNNYERDVVGTISQDGINRVDLTGAISGTHAFFFTYTDHDINPDYSVFYNVISSFRLK